MQPKRPSSVSPDATLVYPGQQFGPGVGVQAATLRSITSQIQHYNNMVDLNYERALSNWQANAWFYQAYNLQGPPQPLPPPHASLKITYADAQGDVITDQNIWGTGLQYAWVEEVYA